MSTNFNVLFKLYPPRWSTGRRSSLLTRETIFKPRIGQVAIDSPPMQSCTVGLCASSDDGFRQLVTP